MSDAPRGNGAEPPIIRIRGLKTRLGGRAIHRNLDLDVRRGEVLGVVGGSGTGKSVLLRAIVGLVPIRAGTIEVFGENMASLSDEERRRIDKEGYEAVQAIVTLLKHLDAERSTP